MLSEEIYKIGFFEILCLFFCLKAKIYHMELIFLYFMATEKFDCRSYC